MNKQILITSLEKQELMEKIPATYYTTPVYTITPWLEKNTFISCTWEDISSIFQENEHIILYSIYDTNDELLQGKKVEIKELILLLFLKAAKLSGKKLSYLDGDSLIALDTLHVIHKIEEPPSKHRALASKKTVTSIQKIPTTVEKPAFFWVKNYFSWLESFTLKIIKIKENNNTYSFCVRGLKKPLLTLQKNEKINNQEMVELIISGGFLNKERGKQNPTGRFWFVTAPEEKTLYTALVHFKPTLTWPLYLISQGIIHQIVMFFFKKHLGK